MHQNTADPAAKSFKISLIMTVFNEGESIRAVMESLLKQTRQPDEIVIVDGGSTDTTVAIMKSFENRLPLAVIVSNGCNISEGRNIAIRAATGDVIAATDAGVRLPDDWLEYIVVPFERNAKTHVSAGFFHADPYTPFEVAMGAAVLPLEDEIDPPGFLPSSRSVAFRKTAWEAVGGYPEWLDYCEDLVYDINLHTLFSPFGWAPRAQVAFQPRTSLRAYWKQYYLYARGDGKADLWRKRHAIRYATYLVAAPIIVLLGMIWEPLLWGLFLVGGAVYMRPSYRRVATVWRWYRGSKTPRWTDRLAVLLWVPVIRIVGDIAKMVGYPVGWSWRLRNRPPAWRVSSK